MQEQLLNERQVAELLGLQVRTLQGWRFRRRGPGFIRISGKCVRYSPATIQAWIDAHAKTTAPVNGHV